MMIQESLRKAELTEKDAKASFEALQSRLRSERSILTRLAELEGQVNQGKMLFESFKADIDEYCEFNGNPGEWMAGELCKLPRNLATVVGLATQLAAQQTAKAHHGEIIAGLRKAFLVGPEDALATFKRENAPLLKKYSNSTAT